MTWLQWSRIRCATRYCLAECSQSDYPLVFLSDFATFLRSIGWSELEVESVESLVSAELASVSESRGETAELTQSHPF